MAHRTNIPTVVIAGGGYAGLLAANRIAGKLGPAARVLLITPGKSLVDRIRLHEAAARGKRVEHALRSLLHTAVEHIDARAVALDPSRRQLTVANADSERALSYDWLLLALGSRFASPIPAHSEHAFALASPASALALWNTVRTLRAGARVAVVGGGLTAIELASELAEAHPHISVQLFASELAAGLSGPAQEKLREALEKSGVIIRTGARVAELSEDAVVLSDGAAFPCEVSVLASGFAPAPLGSRFMLPADGTGRVAVDAHLRVPGLDNVFIAGDLAAPPPSSVGSGLASTRMGCVSAMPLGAHAADQIVRASSGRPLTPFHFSYFIQCISVGRRQGIIASVDRDDRPTGRVLSGRSGAVTKELVCRFVVAAIRLERMFAGLYAWPGRRVSPRLPRAVPNRLPG